MHDIAYKPVARRALALAVSLVACGVATTVVADEPISFVLPAANFQPVPADAYRDPGTPPPVPIPPNRVLTPPQVTPTPDAPNDLVSPEGTDSEGYVPNESYETLECPNCNGGCNGGCDGGCGLPPGRLPNGQYPDDWMWGCGQWPYANGPGTCDDWKVGPIWDVTVDGMVMTRERANLTALQDRMEALHTIPPITEDPAVIEQFDRGPGGRVYLTGLVPRNVGYQVLAGYEGIEEWNAAIVYPEEPEFPAFGTPTSRRNLYYRSSLHSGELNILRMCNPALRPYCGVRYIKFDDEIWDQSLQTMTPFPGVAANAISTLDSFDIENNLIGFQGGMKYDVWQIGKRFSLQGFMNGGVYYNKAKYSNFLQEFETQYAANGSSTSDANSSLTIVEQSNVAYVGEASLTAVCRLNKCWACRLGYQVLWIDGVNLAQEAYLGENVDGRSLIFHGWHAGVECRR